MLHDLPKNQSGRTYGKAAVMKFDKVKQRWMAETIERKRRSEQMRASLVIRGNPVFRKFNIAKVILFGSVLDGRSNALSDLDVLVISLKKDDYWTFRHELDEAVGYPVDLYTQDDDPLFLSKIMKRGAVVYGT